MGLNRGPSPPPLLAASVAGRCCWVWPSASLLGQPAAAVIEPGTGWWRTTVGGAEEGAGWIREQAFSCGRRLCSTWCSPHTFSGNPESVLAHRSGESMRHQTPPRAAAETRAETVETAWRGDCPTAARPKREGSAPCRRSAGRSAAAVPVRRHRDAGWSRSLNVWNVFNRQALHPFTPTVAGGLPATTCRWCFIARRSPDLAWVPATCSRSTEPDAAWAGSTNDGAGVAEALENSAPEVISESLWGLEFNRRYSPGRSPGAGGGGGTASCFWSSWPLSSNPLGAAARVAGLAGTKPRPCANRQRVR